MSEIIESGRETVVSNELDFKQYEYSHSSYMHTKIFQQNGITNVGITQSGGNESVHQIPAVAFNMFQSFYKFLF